MRGNIYFIYRTMSIAEIFAQIEDPRSPSGRRYTLASIFKLIVCGLIACNNSLTTIVNWGVRCPNQSWKSMDSPKMSTL
ncbi:MAG: transposase family protein [Holosporales bacterium]|jgi:hypothetical protein|nr:transposase family protein [Holosporales bacterium]